MKYAVITFGCRANQADSCAIERRLCAEGGTHAPLDAADLVVINTCAVTGAAELEGRQAVRRARRLNPTARIVATGCYAVRAPADLHALPVSDVLSRDDLLEDGAATAVAPPGTGGRTIHLLRVQTGCDESCSYCIVPSTRGASRSRPLEDVRIQADAAARAGFKEVMLTGVHLGSYGRDLSPRRSLADLVTELASHPSPLRFRLSAVEPMDVGAELVRALSASGRFAHHFHLPLQHASDRMLAAMKRPYTLADYRAAMERLLRAFPGAALGADVMVGFPNESAGDFETCADFLARSPLAYVHVFPFSPRPGTAAETMPGRPDSLDVRRRVTRLRALGAELNRRFRQRFVGKTIGGLTIEDGSLVLTDNYLRVRIGSGLRRNERVVVTISNDGEPMQGKLAGPKP